MAETINMPKLGFDMAEGTLVRWLKKVGEDVHKGEVLAEIETDKATVEVESPASGVIRRLLVDEGAVVPVNSPIAIVGSADEVIAEAPAGGEGNIPPREDQPRVSEAGKPSQAGSQHSEAGPVRMIKASPLAKKIARDRQVDLSKLVGTGPGGRIVKKDIETALMSPASMDQTVQGGMAIPGTSSGDKTIPLTKLRQAIARRMSEAKTTIPHFYVTHEHDVEALLNLREQYNQVLPEQEKISINDLVVKAAALSLRQFPNLNASYRGTEVLQNGQVNIGIAVSVEGGLLTVVCKDADQKPVRQIAAEIKAMAKRAREGKVRPEDIEGSTFSISNLGMYDVDHFVAIINPPEAAILAVGSALERAVVKNGVVTPGWRMKATLSVDHRVSDGVEAAKFLQALGTMLEIPLKLVL